ncbi:diguanylate cyclase [Pseudomonas sp. MLB6B]
MNPPLTPSSIPSRSSRMHQVLQQTRDVLLLWQRLHHTDPTRTGLRYLHKASLRLWRTAEQCEQAPQVAVAQALCAQLEPLLEGQPSLPAGALDALAPLIQQLARSSLRRDDQFDDVLLPALRRPLYLLLQDAQAAERLVQQLAFFGLAAQALDSVDALRSALAEAPPGIVVLDVDFAGPGRGLQLAQALQADAEPPLALLFFSQDDNDTCARLSAARIGGKAFLTGALEASALLEKIERLSDSADLDPFRVLIIDDSRAQALYTERMLRHAGISTRVLIEPLRTMDILADFQPDLIILDMYMPGCTGSELARAIRHNDRYVSVPIIYLSAEADLDKQLEAMSEGGDDFLTKPVQARQLVTTVHNRAARARHLNARLVRDSLTGLYNHTHILQLLEDSSHRARREGQPLSFAMLDIDHFKRINDVHGHPTGDRVLKSLALFLRQRLRRTDFIGRYGGEEFAIVMPDTPLDAAYHLLDDLRQRFAELHYPAHPQPLNCTFSAGVASLDDGMDASQLGNIADEALYAAKHSGRNCVLKAEPAP